MMNTNNQNNTNGVNGRAATGNSVAPGRLSVEDQAGAGRNHATGEEEGTHQGGTNRGRRKWERNDNMKVMECYFLAKNDPRMGYMKRMLRIWREKGGRQDVDSQRLSDQVRVINKNGLLSELEIEEIKRRVTEPQNDGRIVRMNDETGEEEGDLGTREDMTGVFANVTHEEPEELSEEQKILLERLQSMYRRMEREEVMKATSMKGVEHKKLNDTTERVNSVIWKVGTNTIDETNRLICAGALVVCEELGRVKQKEGNREEPGWKTRLERKVSEQRKDLSRLEELTRGKYDGHQYLLRKYHLDEKTVEEVKEMLKQSIIAVTAKIKRYTDRATQYHHNKLFEKDQKRFYNILEGKQQAHVQPDAEEAKTFWSNIWGNAGGHKEDADWLREVKRENERVGAQENFVITPCMVQKSCRGMSPWKAPGPDGVQGYWIKRLTSLHERIAGQLNDIIQSTRVPAWMTKGRTVLIPKDPTKGNIPSNFRPITCLPLMWKLLTSMISDILYEHLAKQDLLPWEQKGCTRGGRGTKEQLVINKATMKDSKARSTNLTMGWIDYKKAYDMVPHTWIDECLEMYKVNDRIRNMMKNSMATWRTVLECKGEELGEVKIRRGIFQGDSLSPLLFVMAMIPLTSILRKAKPGYVYKNKTKINHLLYMDDLKLYGKSKDDMETLMNTVRVFSDDIGMQFGIDKCAITVIKRGKLDNRNNDIVLGNQEKITSLDENNCYKYLGMLEVDNIKQKEMKTQIEKEYIRRLRKILKSKLNAGNLVKAINTWAVSLVRYGGGIIDWNQKELEDMDRRTRKMMHAYGAVHPRADVDRLYVQREDGGRGLMSILDTVRYEEQSMIEYIRTKDSGVMATVKLYTGKQIEDSKQVFKDKQQQRRKEGWQTKAMHGQHVRQTKDFAAQTSWQWLKRGSLKRQTESLIIAAQDQALRTNYRKARIEHSRESALCRMCKTKDETVTHIISECSKMAQTEYKGRHDRVAAAVHWSILKAHGLPHTQSWYEHRAEKVVENEDVKVLWDFNVFVDKFIEARRPDIILVKKKVKECVIIDIAVPGDVRTKMKEEEKIDKYQDLAREISRLWGMSTTVVPIIIGALGTITDRLTPFLSMLGVTLSFETIQKSALLGTAHILRKVLEKKD